MPLLLTPLTVPVVVTDSAPVPVLSARMPSVAPVTAAAAMVRLVPVLEFRAKMPRLLVPVTAPVVVTNSALVP